jgi:hypothetical protein
LPIIRGANAGGVRLREKGGKQHEMPAHHLIEHYLAAYVTAAGIGTDNVKSRPIATPFRVQ